MSRRLPPRPPATPPGSADEGAAYVITAAVSIFDRGDGTGADWHLMTKSLFKAAFLSLDNLPDDARLLVARRVHEGSYNRMLPGPVGGDSATSNRGPAGPVSISANTNDLQSNGPRPPR